MDIQANFKLHNHNFQKIKYAISNITTNFNSFEKNQINTHKIMSFVRKHEFLENFEVIETHDSLHLKKIPISLFFHLKIV
jgi:ribosomal protein S3AE